MRPALIRGNIRCAGAVANSPLGLLDEPILPQQNGSNQVVFVPFKSGIGTTTLVQRLCGSNAIDPNPSSGINGYRASWRVELDPVTGSCRYENFFIWDVCYEIISKCPELGSNLIQSAKIIVLLIPAEDRQSVQRLISWHKANITEPQKTIVVVTRCDRLEAVQIRPPDVRNITNSLNTSVIQISAANITPEGKAQLQPSIKNLVVAIADLFCLTVN